MIGVLWVRLAGHLTISSLAVGLLHWLANVGYVRAIEWPILLSASVATLPTSLQGKWSPSGWREWLVFVASFLATLLTITALVG